MSYQQKVDVAIVGTKVVDYQLPIERFPRDVPIAKAGEVYLGALQHAPRFADTEYEEFIDRGWARAGGQLNILPQMARAGLNVAGLAALGGGSYDGLDVSGNFIRRVMKENNVGAFHYIYDELPTANTFITPYPSEGGAPERKGITYYRSVNSLLDPHVVAPDVVATYADVVFLVYIGLQDKFDRNLEYFFKTLKAANDCIVGADTHTIAGVFGPGARSTPGTVNPHVLVASVLNELDIFFCSSAEARLIAYANKMKCNEGFECGERHELLLPKFLEELYTTYVPERKGRVPIFGLTTAEGAFVKTQGQEPALVRSNYLVAHDELNLVGAGDAWRAGFLAYVAKNKEAFKEGKLDIKQAAQMGNQMAVLSITAPDNDRYGQIGKYEDMLRVVEANTNFNGQPLINLLRAVRSAA